MDQQFILSGICKVPTTAADFGAQSRFSEVMKNSDLDRQI